MKTRSLFLALAAAAFALPLRAADVSVYAVTKVQNFEQPSIAAPTVLVTGGYNFGAIVVPAVASPSSVTSATLRLPDTTTLPMGPVSGVGQFAVSGTFDTQAAMDAVYGSGNYVFTIVGVNDGTRTPTRSHTGSSYPTTLRITNFTAAQSIDWTQDFTLTWTPFAGGETRDYIQLIIRRSNGSTLYKTPDFGSTGALTGTATSTTVPANALVPGRLYSATLIFGNVTDINITAYGLFDLVPGVAAFAKTTVFPMQAPGTTPILEISKGATSGSYDLTWNADLGRAYDLRRSQDFVTWARVALVTADTAAETVTDTPAASVKSRFYRLDAVP